MCEIIMKYEPSPSPATSTFRQMLKDGKNANRTPKLSCVVGTAKIYRKLQCRTDDQNAISRTPSIDDVAFDFKTRRWCYKKENFLHVGCNFIHH